MVNQCHGILDLQTCQDFFLWGYLKNVVYSKTLTTRENMMENITLACRSKCTFIDSWQLAVLNVEFNYV